MADGWTPFRFDNKAGRQRCAGAKSQSSWARRRSKYFVLVSLAAASAMIEVNLLLTLHGGPSDSFVMNDLMRLLLGILAGMGFIGAWAIVRREISSRV